MLFGPAQSLVEFSVDGAGSITCNITGRYMFIVDAYIHRTTSSGVANLFLRALVNGVQVGNPVGLSMDDNGNSVPLQRTFIANMTATDIITFEFLRDSSGINSGQLLSLTPITGWGQTPSTRARIFTI